MFPRCHLAALRDGAIDGKIDAVGGFHGRELETVEVYDPQADSWQRVASMPQCLCDHAAAAVGGKIYVTGENGFLVVLKQGSELEVLAKNDLGESCVATPAIANDRIYVRTLQKLYCFAESQYNCSLGNI